MTCVDGLAVLKKSMDVMPWKPIQLITFGDDYSLAATRRQIAEKEKKQKLEERAEVGPHLHPC